MQQSNTQGVKLDSDKFCFSWVFHHKLFLTKIPLLSKIYFKDKYRAVENQSVLWIMILIDLTSAYKRKSS